MLAGTIGSKDVQITCLKCGNKFKAGEALSYYGIQKVTSVNKPTELPQGVHINKRETFTKFNYRCPLCDKIYNGDLRRCPKCGRDFLDKDKTNDPIVEKSNGGCATVILFFIILGSVLYTII